MTDVREGVPRHLGRIIKHCLEKDPDLRYQSAKDVRNELAGLKDEVKSGEVPLAPAPCRLYAASRSRARRDPCVADP